MEIILADEALRRRINSATTVKTGTSITTDRRQLQARCQVLWFSRSRAGAWEREPGACEDSNDGITIAANALRLAGGSVTDTASNGAKLSDTVVTANAIIVDTVASQIKIVTTPSSEQVISSTQDGAISMAAADLNGDGRLDVVSASYDDDMVAWFQNDSMGAVVLLVGVLAAVAEGIVGIGGGDRVAIYLGLRLLHVC